MAAITQPYTYTNGNILDTDGHNSNIFNATPGLGIMSEPNGGLDESTNLAAGFKIQSEHIHPEEACRCRVDYGIEALDYVDSAFPYYNEERFTPISGAGIRFKVPYRVSLALLQWSIFRSVWRFKEDDPDIDSEIVLKAFLDGTPISHTRRTIAPSVYFGGLPVVVPRESRSCLHLDQSHLVENLSAGWHELQVRLYMEIMNTSQTIRRTIEGSDVDASHKLHNRITIGIRNARVLTIL